MKCALLFDHFGPYHLARLRGAAVAGLEVNGVEFYGRSRDYAWAPSDATGLPVETVCCGEPMMKAEFRTALWALLDRLKPEAVAIPGWAGREALTALHWCLVRRVPAIMMSESCAHDEVRTGWKEWVKRRILSCCSSALAGGSLHQRYLKELGMEDGRISLGYDAVDNDYFAERARLAREKAGGDRQGMFLASARFIAKKNLPRLIEAYAHYRQAVKAGGRSDGDLWSLILLGDGELRPVLERQVNDLGLQGCVSMPGFLQYDELPGFYARASVFIHASTTEQWGLVVNEAMASGLPVLVSNRCGSTEDLVQDGINGFTFAPDDTAALAQGMIRLAALPAKELMRYGQASREIVTQWGPERFGCSLRDAVERAVRSPRRSSLTGRLLVQVLSSR